MSKLSFMAALALLGLAACVSQPVYGPKGPGQSAGYTDEQLGANRYRVTYTGNAATDRETVEDFLLYRSAEVTLKSGFGHFEFDTRDTKSHTTYYSTFTGGWPGWPYHHRYYGWYWHSWPFPDEEMMATPITRYEAYAEIVMLTDAEAKDDPHAIDANDIITRLGPKVHPPEQKPAS
ncbi:MAG TPA: hypothetical protein VLW75_06075 [Rhizomicrobium sp.]|nr:hypothetical protein [Rhizomicrobium sp.]